MKTAGRIILIIYIAFMNNQCYSQDSIKPDTTITKQYKVLETFSLNFKACKSCGYDWKIANPVDSTKLKYIASTTIKNSLHTIGGFATKSFTFQGLAKGDYQLIFVYKRPWLNEIEKKEIFNIKIE